MVQSRQAYLPMDFRWRFRICFSYSSFSGAAARSEGDIELMSWQWSSAILARQGRGSPHKNIVLATGKFCLLAHNRCYDSIASWKTRKLLVMRSSQVGMSCDRLLYESCGEYPYHVFERRCPPINAIVETSWGSWFEPLQSGTREVDLWHLMLDTWCSALNVPYHLGPSPGHIVCHRHICRLACSFLSQ